ncbi:granzyme M [Helicoverpa armigera]|uniref:granzyme M n=1 Tax=Helicoverpa armigera TaxID=29058 RepID=UPI003083D1BF
MEKIVILFALAVCGATAISFESTARISGGGNALVNQFPYAVSLQQINLLNEYTRGHACGGVLITYQHVLTAASCIQPRGSQGQIIPNQYRVFAGSISLTNDTNADLIRTPANFTVHPSYTGYPALANNLAIITLVSAFPAHAVTPISLPSATFDPADFTICNVVGWGAQNNSASASVNLRYASKYIYNQNLCTFQYSSLEGTPNILPSMLCATSYDILSAGCMGDIGNPLVCQGGLTGILSVHNSCASLPFPEVYTRVSNYTTWIRSVTGGASTFQPAVATLIIFALVQLITAKVIS